MPEKISELKKPTGLSRWAFRLPISLYHAGLGWLLGHRFVLLTHTGRKSGLPRYTVLEVVRYDRLSGECIVASGWGYKSDWIKNVTANPRVFFQVGGKKAEGFARQLPPEEGAQELLDYSRRYPMAFKEITRFMGYQINGTEADIRAAGRILPMFLLKPDKEV